MRTIKFRGKDAENGMWIYGDLFQRIGFYPQIIEYFADDNGKLAYRGIAVQENTVCQFTGLHDKDGKEIYEGDIVQSVYYKDFVYKVVYDDNRFASFCLERKKNMFRHFFGEAKDCEVIGNIYDNPELLKGE